MRRCVAFTLVLAVVAPVAQADAAAKPRLKRFSDCSQLVSYANRHATRYEPGGPPPQIQPTFVAPQRPGGPETAGSPPQPAAAPAPTSSAGSGDSSFSLTNNQEAGVFEPDSVKTDGSRIYTLTSGGVLHVVSTAGAPVQTATLALGEGYGHKMLLYENKLLISWSNFQEGTTLALVDVSDAAKPVLLRTLEVDGDLLAERRTRGTVRVVLSVRPRAILQPAQADPSSPRAWLPTARLANVRRHTTTRKALVKCRAVRRPRAFSGLESLTVLTIDLDKGLDPVDADALMTGGDIVYSSATNLFVSTHRYQPRLEEQTQGEVPDGQTTQLHRFSLDDARNTTYRGSGQVPGYLLNQFSLSEQGDVLRVASTDVPPWFDRQAESHSLVTTLREKEDRLERLGQIGGLGKNERIYAVRFLGDVGYVVTFRQIDPLFVVDLADPAKPRLRGELELPGYSAYLHPIAGDRLIGVGYGPSADGTEFGLQVSAFDVSDLDRPRLQQRTTLDGGNSEVAYDHLAFLWWAPRDLAVLPVQQFRYDRTDPPPEPGPTGPTGPPQAGFAPAPSQSFVGAIGFTVRPAGIAEAGRVSHGNAVVRRSLVIGDTLYTTSDAGVKATALDTFADAGFAAFSGG